VHGSPLHYTSLKTGQHSYLHSLLLFPSHRCTRSSSVITLSRPSLTSRLKIASISFYHLLLFCGTVCRLIYVTLLSLIDWLLYGTSAQKGYQCQETLLNNISSRFVDKYNYVWRNADWRASWYISTKELPVTMKIWMQFNVMPRTHVTLFFTYIWNSPVSDLSIYQKPIFFILHLLFSLYPPRLSQDWYLRYWPRFVVSSYIHFPITHPHFIHANLYLFYDRMHLQ